MDSAWDGSVQGLRGNGWRTLALEVAVSCGVAVALVIWAGSVDVAPLDRVGQVSALASLQLAFVVVAVAAVSTVFIGRNVVQMRGLAPGLAAALLAGGASGIVAAGVRIGLRGTHWGLFANKGDVGQIAAWAQNILDGVGIDFTYPPGFLWALAGLSAAMGEPPGYAIKTLSILCTALIGPIGYLSWRLVFRPWMALVTGVVCALPLVDPYKPLTNTMLVLLVPVLISIARTLGEIDQCRWGRVIGSGVAYGVVLGLIGLVYSGWFAWSALGAMLLFGIAIPWKRGLRAIVRSGVLLGGAGAVFLAVAGVHLWALVGVGGASRDDYFYFDALSDPAYVAMWRGDMPGLIGPWPPLGELGGVGVFTLIVAAGLGVSLATCWRSGVVRAAALIGGGAWLMRHYLASSMYAEQSVQLWPRTTPVILYCLLLMCAVVTRALYSKVVSQLSQQGVRPDMPAIGFLIAVAFVLASAGSATAERYMPAPDGSTRELAWVAHTTNLLDGRCPETAPQGLCVPK